MSSTRHRHEEAQPNYLIHPVDIPAHHVIEEKPSRVPTFSIDVLASTAVFGMLVFLALYSFYRDFWPGGWAAILTLVFFVMRLGKVFDVPIPFFKESTFQDVAVRMAPPPRTVPVSAGGEYQGQVQLRNPKTIRGSLGNVELSGRQLDMLLKIIDDPEGDGKYRRETSSLGRGVMEIGITTAQDPILKAALKEKGFIDDNQYWTDEGREWVAKI